MTEKRFNRVGGYVYDGEKCISHFNDPSHRENIVELLNELSEENEQLKSELKIYRKVANCGNCHYHNYDWFDDGDEFEVCDKGNDMSDRICEDWVEL